MISQQNRADVPREEGKWLAKLVFGMNQSLDGYVDHMAFAPGGTQPRWGRNGEVFYIGPDSRLMAVKVSADHETLQRGVPVALFQTRIAGGALVPAPNKQQYDVSHDGGQFIINTSTEEVSTSAITLILNWKPH